MKRNVWFGSIGSSVTITNHMYLNITFLDSASVKGTFGGDFYNTNVFPATKKSITNGDFSVRWK